MSEKQEPQQKSKLPGPADRGKQPVQIEVPAALQTLPRQKRTEAKTEPGSTIIAKLLGGQLGSSPKILAQMQIDELKLSVMNPYLLTALNHFAYRAEVDGNRFWAYIYVRELVGSQSINGLARRQILQAIANSSGIQIQSATEKPNMLARNLWKRDWKDKAEMEGQEFQE